MSQSIQIKLTRISGEQSKNLIPIGSIVVGDCYDRPTVGEPFYVGMWATTKVTEVLSEDTFKTSNSVYKWEEL